MLKVEGDIPFFRCLYGWVACLISQKFGSCILKVLIYAIPKKKVKRSVFNNFAVLPFSLVS